VSSLDDLGGMLIGCDALNTDFVDSWNLSDEDARSLFVHDEQDD